MARENRGKKICKYCQSEIPVHAKICPYCRKKVKGGIGKWIVLAVLFLFVASALLNPGTESSQQGRKTESPSAGISQNTASRENNSSVSDTQVLEKGPVDPGVQENQAVQEAGAIQEKEFYTVGDEFVVRDLKMVYMASGIYASDNEFLQPKEGCQYIFLQLFVQNVSASSDRSISAFSFTCYADGYAADSFYGGDGIFSATLSPGRTATGYLYFEVPAGAETIEVEYEADMFSGKKTRFLYEGEKDAGYVPEAGAAASDSAYNVGDVVESSNLRITYLSCEEYVSDNMFLQPQDGNHYISCLFEFENLGQSDQWISSGSFDAYADGASCSQTYVRDDTLSATLSAGRKVQGSVTFEVPLSAGVVEVEYLDNMWTSRRIVFAVTP